MLVPNLVDSTNLALVQVVDLKVGDSVTEVDTPGGPFYRVTSVDRDAGEFTLDGDVTLPIDAEDAYVLRRFRAGEDGPTEEARPQPAPLI